MKRREFLITGAMAAGGWIPGLSRSSRSFAAGGAVRIRWKRPTGAPLFSSVHCDGTPLVVSDQPGLLDAVCRLESEAAGQSVRLNPKQADAKHGPLQVGLEHRLHNSGAGFGEDVLEATLTVRNESDRPQQVELALETCVLSASASAKQQAYLPLSAAGLHGDRRFAALGASEFLKDCNQTLEHDDFQCHYLEPMASYPNQRKTRALLLAPVVDLQQLAAPWRAALFTPSDQPVRFRSTVGDDGRRVWRVGRIVTAAAGETVKQRCWLMVHRGDAKTAWRAFHRLAHHERHPLIGWIGDFRVHYYDFLSSAAGKEGRRGDGYDAAAQYFRPFHVGMATQHGYYPCMGDHIRPQRKTWRAMQGDAHGPAEMSIEKMKARIKATRAAGAKAAIYMHLTAMDDASEIFDPQLAAGRRFDSEGRPVPFGWNGPDVVGRLWWMSIAAAPWRSQLLQQARWIMEILQPDAICIDETFSGIGYDEAPDRRGPISPHAIALFKEMHDLVRSFGEEKALFTSDCSMSGFCLWADGEVGDHAYPGLLGHPLYRQAPVRYLAALGDKPWRPCAWHFRRMWEHQMALARQVGAGVGVSNGWIEYTGLHLLPADERSRLIRDIESLCDR